MVYRARYSPRRVVGTSSNGASSGLPSRAWILGHRSGQVFIEGSGGVQGELVRATAGSGRELDRVRWRFVHSPAARRSARSAAISSAENTRPARASASPSRRSRTSSLSDSTSIVSRSRSSSPEGTISATWTPWAITDTDSPCSARRTTSAQDGWSSARTVTTGSLTCPCYASGQTPGSCAVAPCRRFERAGSEGGESWRHVAVTRPAQAYRR